MLVHDILIRWPKTPRNPEQTISSWLFSAQRFVSDRTAADGCRRLFAEVEAVLSAVSLSKVSRHQQGAEQGTMRDNEQQVREDTAGPWWVVMQVLGSSSFSEPQKTKRFGIQ